MAWPPQSPVVVLPPAPADAGWYGHASAWEPQEVPRSTLHTPHVVFPPNAGGPPAGRQGLPKPPLPMPWPRSDHATSPYLSDRPPLPSPIGYLPAPAGRTPAGITPTPSGPTKAPAFAVLSSDRGPVLAPAEAVPGMLRADWAFFLELASYALHGISPGTVAFGVEEVSEAVAQAAVAVLFIPVGCGHGGESAVRRVAAAGGRGYIVGLAHELHDDVAAWGAAAVLRQPLQRRLAAGRSRSADDWGGFCEPERKRQRHGEAGDEMISAGPESIGAAEAPTGASESGHSRPWTGPGLNAALSVATPKAAMVLAAPPPPPPDLSAAKPWPEGPAAPASEHPALPAEAAEPADPSAAPAPGESTAEAPAAATRAPASPPKPQRPEDHERDLRRAIRWLGKLQSLHDRSTIPSFGEALRDRYLPALGAVAVFSTLGDSFVAASGVAHRKAMVYSAHELIMRKRGRALAVDDRRVSCVRHFFMRIGKAIRGFKAEERHSYIRLVGAWQAARSFHPEEFTELKEAWDVD
mmetsp:Transcript_92917/g.277285  ORF Transcript_92917/g.277285 Transcript_92917/m.277285 type:complete len:523 (-) Transcript_92917:156-1724(-)